MRDFEGLSLASEVFEGTNNIILIFSKKDMQLKKAYSYKNSNEAVLSYFEYEKNASDNEDIVLVSGDTNEGIRQAFKNYFSDARDFVKFIKNGIMKI